MTLRPPFLFDQSIGYWTGDPDREALRRALGAVPPDPRVQREVRDDSVLLTGPEDAVQEEARRLRAAGLL